MGCAGVLAMPNTLPPVSKVTGQGSDEAWSLESYRALLLEAGADQFEKLTVPLYLTQDIATEEIADGASQGLLEAAKYYPPHGTTNSQFGVPMDKWIGSEIFEALEDNGVILCVHGESHGKKGPDYFDEFSNAESHFYSKWMPRLLDAHPRLRIVCEHITTREAVHFVDDAPENQVAATVTPQHLLFTAGHLIQGFRYHLYCLPVVKFERDRAALRDAVTRPGQIKFFAGTDSAPHVDKVTECGCAAGCYTGGWAAQLYALAFEEAGADLAKTSGQNQFRAFLCENGPDFYGFDRSEATFELIKEPEHIAVEGNSLVTPLPQGMSLSVPWRVEV